MLGLFVVIGVVFILVGGFVGACWPHGPRNRP